MRIDFAEATDWQAIYLDGNLIAQDNVLDIWTVLNQLEDVVIECGARHVICEEWFDEQTSLPTSLDDAVFVKSDSELEKIALEIISSSDGCFDIALSEEYFLLSPAQKAKVDTWVYADLDNCSLCGWYFTYDSMESHGDANDTYCWRCYEDVEEEEGEEDAD